MTRSARPAAARTAAAIALRVVALDVEPTSPRSRPRAPARRASTSWCRGSRPGRCRRRRGRTSSPVGSTATTGARYTSDVGGSGRGRGGDVDGAQAVSCGQQQLGGADVLADRAHVLRTAATAARSSARSSSSVDVLAHDHRVEALGQRIAGVDDAHTRRDRGRRERSRWPRTLSAARTAMPSIAAASKAAARSASPTPALPSRARRRRPARCATVSRRDGQPAAAHAERHAASASCRRHVADEWGGRHQRYSVTSTVVPASSPVAASGTHEVAVGLAQDRAAAPRGRRAASRRRRAPSTWTTSSRPAADGTSRARRAVTTGSGGGAAQPPTRRTTGIPTRRKTTSAERGLPGRPISGTPPQSASSVGLPGRSASPWQKISPRPTDDGRRSGRASRRRSRRRRRRGRSLASAASSARGQRVAVVAARCRALGLAAGLAHERRERDGDGVADLAGRERRRRGIDRPRRRSTGSPHAGGRGRRSSSRRRRPAAPRSAARSGRPAGASVAPGRGILVGADEPVAGRDGAHHLDRARHRPPACARP